MVGHLDRVTAGTNAAGRHSPNRACATVRPQTERTRRQTTYFKPLSPFVNLAVAKPLTGSRPNEGIFRGGAHI